MPSRNTVKNYQPDAMYHIYNRGVNKMNIFTDERDYAVFLSFLKSALTKESDFDPSLLSEAQRFNMRRIEVADELDLVSYCLMPNHFHLLLYQYESDAITRLMRSVATGYSMYFNKRHNRLGSLFQGVYKASHINSDAYWWHISRYIHLNPLDINLDYKNYNYSSYKAYMKKMNAEWINPDLVLDGFNSSDDYAKFVESYVSDRKDFKEIKELLANCREFVQGSTLYG